MNSIVGHPDQRWGGISYAQHGDDFFLRNVFELIGIDKPSYLDIGAHHPTIISNTKLLYDAGSRGINIDANPELLEAFRKERPLDKNINVGVGPEEATMPFYLFNHTPGHNGAGRNTFCETEKEQMEREGHSVKRIVNVEVHTLTWIVNNHCGGRFPDLLSLDVEGFDYGILETARFFPDHSPKVICVEVRKHQSEAFKAMLALRGFFSLVRLAENMIFVRNEYESRVR